jgi:hypothetical protein
MVSLGELAWEINEVEDKFHENDFNICVVSWDSLKG